MTEIRICKPKFDLEDRTYAFAKEIGVFNREIIPKTLDNETYFEQLIRSSGSVAANLISISLISNKNSFRKRLN